MAARVRYQKVGRVGTVTLVSPKDLNALKPEMLEALSRCIDRIEADDEVRVVVLQGAGRSFSAGYSLRAWSDRFEMTTKVARWDPIKDYRAMARNVSLFMRL